MKYDGGRLQNVFFCFKISLHENIKINILYQSLMYLYSFFLFFKTQCKGTVQSHFSRNVTVVGDTLCINLCACSLDVFGMLKEPCTCLLNPYPDLIYLGSH